MQNFDAKSTDVAPIFAYLGNRREISSRLLSDINPKGCRGGGPKVPSGQKIVCHFSQGHAMVTTILDFIHKHPN